MLKWSFYEELEKVDQKIEESSKAGKFEMDRTYGEEEKVIGDQGEASIPTEEIDSIKTKRQDGI